MTTTKLFIKIPEKATKAQIGPQILAFVVCEWRHIFATDSFQFIYFIHFSSYSVSVKSLT